MVTKQHGVCIEHQCLPLRDTHKRKVLRDSALFELNDRWIHIR